MLPRDVEWISSRSHIRHISRILRLGIPNMTVKKIREYLEQVDDAQCCPPHESAQLWADYLQMLKILECDLSDRTVIYPNSLKREHDKASRKASQVQDERMAKKFRGEVEALKEQRPFRWVPYSGEAQGEASAQRFP